MSENSKTRIIENHISDHVNSPSLRHIRDDNIIHKLAQKITYDLEGSCSVWTKWTAPRDTLLTSAAECSIPVEHMRDFLNNLPGPELTTTDVSQRLRAIHNEDPFIRIPTAEMREGSLSIFDKEKSQGTELPAIIGAIQEYIDQIKEQEGIQAESDRQARLERERIELEEKFLSGSDCKWVSIDDSKELYCRVNGQAYSLYKAGNKTWNLNRINSIEGPSRTFIGSHQNREEATKALTQLSRQLDQKR